METTVMKNKRPVMPKSKHQRNYTAKLIIALTIAFFFALGSVNILHAQQEDILEVEKDTLNIDQMDPVFYEDATPKDGNATTTVIIIVAIVIIGGIVYYLAKKKKQ